jgi:tetratricopeptide (TPR) repeat protein
MVVIILLGFSKAEIDLEKNENEVETIQKANFQAGAGWLAMNQAWGIVVYDKMPEYLTVGSLKDIYISSCLATRVALLAGLLILSACAYQQPTDLQAAIKPAPLRPAGNVVQITDVDVLEVSPAMEEFLERYVLEYSNKHTRATLLMNAVSANGVLGFDYQDSYTLTSVDAFDSRAGNCLGFANMLIALARKAGLKANYQEVFRRPQWSSRDETVLLVKHINVVLESPGYTYVMDVSGVRINPNARRRIIGDSYAKALYLNNIGVDSLIKDDLPTAHAYMAKAIETEPRLTDSWVNMGVVLGRNEQLNDAASSLRKALLIDPTEYAALSNLYEVYIAMEDVEAAAQIEDRVERYRQKNPYYLLQLSEEALERNRFEDSTKLLQRALRINKNDHQLHFAMAKTLYLSGETEAAGLSLLRARELAAGSMIAYYDRPLNELIEEEVISNNSE